MGFFLLRYCGFYLLHLNVFDIRCAIALSGYLILVCYIYYPLLAALFCKRAEELRKQSKKNTLK